MDAETAPEELSEVERLRRDLAAMQEKFWQTRRELFDARCKLSLISRILNRPVNNPATTSAAVRAVLPNRGRFDNPYYPRRSI